MYACSTETVRVFALLINKEGEGGKGYRGEAVVVAFKIWRWQ
jgi:hypothetical protein